MRLTTKIRWQMCRRVISRRVILTSPRSRHTCQVNRGDTLVSFVYPSLEVPRLYFRRLINSCLKTLNTIHELVCLRFQDWRTASFQNSGGISWNDKIATVQVVLSLSRLPVEFVSWFIFGVTTVRDD
jgi:hypothetical protein